jgi:nucleotide-binding universal stress UspA family protein
MHHNEKIIACVDGSSVTPAVADAASWAAQKWNAPLEFLHILSRHPALSHQQDHSGAIGMDAQENLLQQLSAEDEQRTRLAREQGRLLLQGLSARARALGVTTVDTRLRHGEVEETLAEQQEGARLLVLGRAGTQPGKLGRANPMGSHLEWVVRSVQQPVLVITAHCPPPTRVLWAFDGQSVARKTMQKWVDGGLLQGLPITVLMAGQPGAAQRRQLDELLRTLRAAGLEATELISAGSVQAVVTGAIAAQGFDLLVMGAYSHSPLRKLLMGSKTSNLLQAVQIPTLLLR